MASQHEVKCINKSNRFNPHERILFIGGPGWRLSQEDAIRAIEEGKYSFYVSRNNRTVKVIVATSSYGHKYIKTEADGDHPDNLLSLPECPKQ